jgi:hypothetical protein
LRITRAPEKLDTFKTLCPAKYSSGLTNPSCPYLWLANFCFYQRAAGAEIAILVSSALPKGVEAFGYVEGIWVTDYRYALALAVVLRQSLIEIASARLAYVGQNTKMELVYQYLTGPKFRHRVEAIVEKFSEMKDDLDKERKAMTRLWAKREAQIRGVIESTVGMYGDLQGIAGKALQEIDGLELPLIEAQVEALHQEISAVPTGRQ